MGENKKNKKLIIAAVALVLIVALGVGVYAAVKMTKLNKTVVDVEELKVSEEAEEELGDTYVNVAVFGINARSEKDDTADSDAVYVASLNTRTKEVKILPVYGNAMLKKGAETVRMKDTYAEGGPEEAIAVLNENLNLNIKHYVSVNFKAMVEAIDILGGVEIQVTKEEIPHINGYAEGIAKELGEKAVVLKKEGKQILNGIQAVGYCRIRITEGGDVKRNERQASVISAMLDSLTEARFTQMNKIIDKVFEETETNFEMSELLDYGQQASLYSVKTLAPFPRKIEAQVRQEKKKGETTADYEEEVVAIDLQADAVQVYKELFPDIETAEETEVQMVKRQ